ncbi:MAG: PLP-dependent aspartate aminotransferase family protein [Clostridiales bacterium]|nr:PLP-dependent aspartate aminotransferase family protein [Clostridiales bacterium]
MDFQTLCVHGSKRKYDSTGAIAVPIFQTATFAHPGVGQSTGYDYSRTQNPTREHLEATLAMLEGAADAIAFSTGMAAEAALMELFSPGDHVVVSDDLYGGTHRLFAYVSEKNGIAFSRADTAEQIAQALTPRTKAVFIETPTNPKMRVTDIAAVAALLGCPAASTGVTASAPGASASSGVAASAPGAPAVGAPAPDGQRPLQRQRPLLIVDNTFLTPYFQRPIELGADVVLHSGTKYLGGHNDTLAGFLAVRGAPLAERLRFIAKTTGACLSPFDSFLLTRGIKTLAVRMERQQESARRIAEWLLGQDSVSEVFYPGIPSHPGYEISRRQASGFGAMIAFSARDEQVARRALERVRVIQYAESLGGAESLITYPMLQTHADLPEAERRAKGIDERLLRLSVGLESADDLIADLAQAMR